MSQPRRLQFDDLWEVALPGDPAISPDGRRVAYVVKQPDRATDSYRSSIWLAAADGDAPPVRLTQGPKDGSPRWSPDGRTLAFVSSRPGPSSNSSGVNSADRAQIFLLPVGGGEARRLTDLPLGAGAPVWSPEGTRLAFSAAVDLQGVPADDKEGERRANAPLVIDRLGYKADGVGLLKSVRQHVYVTGIDEGSVPVQITWGDWSSSAPTWSPDGQALVFAASFGEDNDLDPGSRLYAVPAAGGGAPRALTPKGYAGTPVFTPDGSTIVYIGKNDTAPGHSRLFAVPASGGEPRDLAPGLDRNVMAGSTGYPGGNPRTTSDGRVFFCIRDRGATHVYAVAVDGGSAPRRVLGDWGTSVSGLTVSADGSALATILSNGSNPGEMVVVRDGSAEPVVLTELFEQSLPGIELFVPEDRVFTAPDGTEIHGWVVRDPAAPKGPLLLDVHGGPHNAWTPVFTNGHHYHQVLAAEGWTILYVNPRGSDGYGEEFMTAVVGAWGTSDTDDFLCGIDTLVAEGLVDNDKLAVTGYSYGGYMTCWLTATTDRFAAGVTGAACSSLESEHGTADMGLWLGRKEVGGDPWTDPELFRRHSPQAHVANVTAPTLILHGETDDRCPVEQGEEWFTALRALGVPVEFVRYPGGSHLFRVDGRPSHRIDFNVRVADWVREWVHPGVDGAARPAAAPLLAAYTDRLGSLARSLNVPGVSVALLHDGEVETAFAGKLHSERPEPVTVDSRFQIGSITKVFTTALIMQLVDEGKVDLDQPVVSYVPEFQLADADATAAITVRQLLNHTSGIPGDWFPDLGDQATTEEYVTTLNGLDLAHPVGEVFSYSNAAFDLAGRLVEVVTGKPWAAVLEERLVQPLGLEMAAGGDPGGGALVGLAMGHLPADRSQPLGAVRPAPRYATHPESAPCGSTPVATPRALAAFARMFIEEGKAPDGAEVLSPAAVKQMAERQIEVPPAGLDGWRWRGLGWGLGEWEGEAVLQHRGGTLGQLSGLTVLPGKGVAVAILTNGPGGSLLARAVEADLFAAAAGITPPGPPAVPESPPSVELAGYAGTFESIGARFEVAVEQGELVARMTPVMGLDPESAPPPPPAMHLTPIDRTTFACTDGSVVSFVGGEPGRPEYVFNGRLHRRKS